MKKIILAGVIGINLLNFSLACGGAGEAACDPVTPTKPCEGGIRLNTNVPFIGNCIMSNSSASSVGQSTDGSTTTVTQESAFPLLLRALTKLVMGVIMLVAFMFVVVGGLRMSMAGIDEGQYKSGRDMIMKAVIAIALIGMSGIILNAINPNFFKT